MEEDALISQWLVDKSVETLPKNLINEAITSHVNQDHAMKAASFAKTLVEKESMLKDLNMALEKWEEEFKLLKWFITFIWYFCLILKDF